MSWLINWWEDQKEAAKAEKKLRIEERQREAEAQTEENTKLNMANSLVGYGLLKHTTDWTYSFGDNAIPFMFGHFDIRAETVGVYWKTKEPYVRFIIYNNDKATFWVGFTTGADRTKYVDISYSKITNWKEAIVERLSEMRERELDESNKILSLMTDIQKAIQATLVTSCSETVTEEKQ